MPPGFQSQDMRSATQKAFTRLPWTENPSRDGKSYLTNGTQIAIDALTNSSLKDPYREIHANDHPDEKNRTLSLPEYFLLNGERGGPMATYLVSATKRPNFKLQMNTTVTRLTRTGEQMSGVQVEASGAGGVSGVINVTPYTGRVILSAGVFGTSKILFRSGIGPRDQLEVVQKSDDGPTMLGEKYWLDLPVGKDLDDAPALYLAVKKDDVGSYDWESAYHNPNPADKEQYLEHRSGPLSMIQPSMGPAFWDTITGSDNRSRVIQWTVNSGYTEGFGGLILFASNLNNGKTSRGRLTIDTNLFVNVTTLPYFNDEGDHDFKALLSSANSVLDIMKSIPNSSVYYPTSGTSMEDYLRDVGIAPFCPSIHTDRSPVHKNTANSLLKSLDGLSAHGRDLW
jgi:cellobiose dehydrogenase (acceptor)